MANSKAELINQALLSAEASIRLAKQLLGELDPSVLQSSASSRGTSSKPKTDTPQPAPVLEKPGILGIFDGESMVTETGEKHPVPANYASKSMLVVGDTLKMIDEDGTKRFKQVEHVKRFRTTGMLTKKDGKFRVVTPEGSYKVLPVSIEHFNGEVGDEVVAYLPAGNLIASYAALESVNKKGGAPTKNSEEKIEPASVEEPKVPAPKKEEKPKEKMESKPTPKPSPKPAPKPVVKEAAPEPKPEPKAAAPVPAVEPAPATPAEIGDDELR